MNSNVLSTNNGAAESALTRHNVQFLGNPDADHTLVFAHGFGCDQHVWRHLVDAFTGHFRVVLFDYAGCGSAHPGSYDLQRHATLQGHADDVIAICDAARLRGPILVGHSVSAMVGALVSRQRPQLLHKLVMMCPTPSYIDDGAYGGGFLREDVDDLLDMLDTNYFTWARMMAPVIMGKHHQAALSDDLSNSFCRFDPTVAKHFARVTFLSDHRADLPLVVTPTLLIQCRDDALAPISVGEYMQAVMPNAVMVVMQATGHCPHLSAPEESIGAVQAYLTEEISAACAKASADALAKH